MTTTKLPPDMVLATPIGGKDIDPELEAKLTDDKQRHKRDRFKALKMPRVEALVQKHKNLQTFLIAVTTNLLKVKQN